jgi:hypothetical protein
LGFVALKPAICYIRLTLSGDNINQSGKKQTNCPETNMCKVYNPIGSLTVIKSHLYNHNVHEYKSLNDLIGFQKNYSFTRQQIISDHQLLIEKEKNTLNETIIQLAHAIEEKRSAVEKQLLSKLETLENGLYLISSGHYNIIHSLVNRVIKIGLKLRIRSNKLFFNFKIALSVRHLTKDYNKANNRHQCIVSYFEDAVIKSSLPHLNELDRKKRIIDEINSSIYGAFGEQKVVNELEKLPDDHILINDFTCMFKRAIYNRRENDYIKSIQIDHILVSPSGVFLIETKNWSQRSLDNPDFYSPVQQVKRTSFVLYKILNGQISNGRFWLKKTIGATEKFQSEM